MWHKLTIGENTFILVCTVAPSDVIECVLYEANASWYEKQSLSDTQKRVKLFNKRIQFNEATICNTLLRLEPTEVAFADDDANERILKLKYRVGSRPLHFEWHLRKSTEKNEIQTALLFSLFKTVRGMTEQIETLRAAVQKKDAEIKQYKREGAILRITTVETKIFDFKEFDEQYAETNDLGKSFRNIGTYLEEKFFKFEPIESNNYELKDTVSENGGSGNAICSKNETSPRNRKRKALAMHQQKLERRLNARKKKVEYEDSQSLSQEMGHTSGLSESSSSKKCVDTQQTIVDHSKKNCAPAARNSKQKSIEETPNKSLVETRCSQTAKTLRSSTKNIIRNKNSLKSTPKKLEYENSESASGSDKEDTSNVKCGKINVEDNDLDRQLKEIQKVFDNLQSCK